MNTSKRFDRTKKIIIGLVDSVIYFASIWLSFYLRYQFEIPQINYSAFISASPYIISSFVLLNILFGMYVLYNKQILDFVYLIVIIQFIMSILIMAMTFLGRWFAFPRTIILVSFLTSTILLFLWRIVVFKFYEKIDGTKRVMVVGSNDSCMKALKNFTNSKNRRHSITKMVTANYYSNIKNNMNDIDIVYIADRISEKDKIKIYDMLIKNEVKLFLNTRFENLILINPNIMSIEDESIIEVSDFHIDPEDEILKGIIDFLVASILVIVTMPIMLLTSLLIKITSPGPVFYKQVRITKNQAEFEILKFRTMSVTAEEESGPVLAAANDTRVTTVGKYLRSLRIDELPQLFNVLKGEMSLVGPRPERPFFVKQFIEQNYDYSLRHNVRAGITGYAQVYGKYTTDFNSKLNFDLVYIKKYSTILDIKILLQTLKTLFDKVSSKGIDEEENENEMNLDNIEIFD